MEERIQKTYQKAASLRKKLIFAVLALYFLLIGLMSIVLGSPFPSRETVWFFTIRKSGWILDSYGLVLIPIGITAVLITLMIASILILKLVHPYVRIIDHNCDAVKYLDYTTYALEYGKDHYVGYQKSLYQLFEELHISALTINRKFDEALDFIKSDSIKSGKRKKERLYWRVMMNKAYAEQDREQFDMIYPNLDLAAKRARITLAYKSALEGNYEEAIHHLIMDKRDTMYRKVLCAFREAEYHAELNKMEETRVMLEFVFEHACTLPVRKDAVDLWNQLKFS